MGVLKYIPMLKIDLMKRILLIVILCLTGMLVNAQSLRFSSMIHPSGTKLYLYKEWPEHELIDTLIFQGKPVTMNLPDTLAVYAIQSRKPWMSSTIFPGSKPVAVAVMKDSSVKVNGGPLQSEWDRIEDSLAPVQAEWNKWGNIYSESKDLEVKLEANNKSNYYAGIVQRSRLQFALQHADDLAGAYMADYYSFAWQPGDLKQLLPAFKNIDRYKPVYDKLSAKWTFFENTKLVGKMAPTFNLESIDGKKYDLQEILKGHKYVLVDFWASWCTPCRATNRKLAPHYKDLQRRGIALVSISVDEKDEAWRKAVASDKIPWLQLISREGMKSQCVVDYKVTSLPSTFLLDQSGKVIQQHVELEELLQL